VQALAAIVNDNLATKQDLVLVKQDILAVKQELKQDLRELEHRLTLRHGDGGHRRRRRRGGARAAPLTRALRSGTSRTRAACR
jgi:hypothetical protein